MRCKISKKNYAILSTELNIPVVPIAISGAYKAMSSGKKRIKWGEKITVEFLSAVYPENLKQEELNEIVKERIMNAVLD